MPVSRAFHLDRNIRLFYGLGLAREFTPLLAVWVVYLTDFRHLTLTQVGVMEGLFWAVKLALEVPSGAFADRFGRRATFLMCIGLEATGTAMFALAGDFTLLVASYVIWSAGLAFRSGNDEAYLFDSLSAGGREPEYSDRIGVYLALGTVSLLAGGLAGGVLAEITTLQIAVAAALVPFALALPLVIMMEEPPRHAAVKHDSMLATLRAGIRAVRENDDLRNILLLQVSLSATFPAFFLLSQPFLDRHGVPLALFGVLAIPIHLGRTGGGLVSGRLTRRFGLASTLTLSVAGAAAGLAIVATVDHVVAFAGIGVTMASVAIALPAIGAYVNERTDSGVRATVLSIAPMGTSLILATTSATAGIIAAGSLRLSFGAMSLATLMLAGGCLALWLGAARTAPQRELEVVEV